MFHRKTKGIQEEVYPNYIHKKAEKFYKQSERESYSHRKRTKVTMVKGQHEGINPITTSVKKEGKIELRILVAMESCFGLVRPRQHGIANT